MADKLAHIVVENTTYDIQDEELTSRINGLTLSLTLTNDFQIKATLTDSIGQKTFESNTIDLPSEDSITELAYDSTEKEIIAKHRNDTDSSQWQRVSIASIIDGLQEELTSGNNILIESNTISVIGLGEASTASTTGIATLDSGGKVPTSQLPSFVDDVLEYSSLSNFPEIGESGKIYVALDDNKTYRWSGSTYVEISQGVVLGETDHTAYRGDRGKTAYDHATETKIGATQTGLYKISTTAQGHVASLTAVQKSDITALGIPGQDTSYTEGDAIEITEQNVINVKTKGGNWNIGRDTITNQLIINGKFVKQVEDLDAYTDAPDGEIVEYIGETDENYTNGYFYKRIAGSTVEYETITIPPNTTYITYHFPDNTEETGYQVSSEMGENGAWYHWGNPIVQSTDSGTLVSANWEIDGDLAKVGDQINVSNNIGYIDSLFWVFRFPFEYSSLVNASTDYANLPTIPSGFNQGIRYIAADTIEEAVDIYKGMCDAVNLPYSSYGYGETVTLGGFSAIINDKHYNIYYSGNNGGYASGSSYQLISNSGKRLFLLRTTELVYNVATELRKPYGEYLLSNDTYYPSSYAPRFYNNYHYNPPTIATLGTTTEAVTITIPILYDENGELIVEEIIQPSWQRIDVQPNVTKTSDLLNDSDFINHLVNNLTNYYTKTEINNLLSTLETNIDWKEAVNTYNDIATSYPNPQDGWTVNVKDTDYTYRWDGTNWIAISANAIPLATQSVNGLMSATDKTKLDGIAAGAEVNAQSDWNQSNINADDYIKNKPVIPTITFRQWQTE